MKKAQLDNTLLSWMILLIAIAVAVAIALILRKGIGKVSFG
jgi:hypothetical protein